VTVRFDDAWYVALGLADEIARTSIDVVVVRDLLGRVSLVVDDRSSAVDQQTITEARRRLRERAGSYAGVEPVTLASELVEPEQVMSSSRDLIVRQARESHQGQIALLERRIVGADWERLSDSPPRNRVSLYGFRGGVGRSTAAFMLAQHFASEQKCVLVVDLDLESPGIGSLLQDPADLPDHGVVDFLVEAGVDNQADLDLVARSQVIRGQGNGEVWLAPAAGRPRTRYDYLPKLNRVYIDIGAQTFGDRLEIAVQECERQVASKSRPPDVVLLDTRSGIHDIAAVTITQLSNLALLFATDSADTWAGYHALFAEWMLSPERATAIRDRLRMVATFVPAQTEEAYLAAFRDHAQACFADTLYDNVGADDAGNLTAFNPAPDDTDAPHSPLPILFSSDLVGLDTSVDRRWSSSDLVQAAYRRLVAGVSELIETEA
jgi:hypothetical protein